MATYYADFDLTTGNNDGSDAANAWRTMADVIAGNNGTVPAAGDSVLCKGTDTTSAVTTVNISGSNTGHIKFIGVDSSWDNVGDTTRAIIDANNGAYVCTSIAGSYIWFENFEFINAGSSGSTYHGVQFASGAYRDYCIFINCAARDNNGIGFDGNGGYARWVNMFKCLSDSNYSGFEDIRGSTFDFCVALNSTSYGYYFSQTAVMNGCMAINCNIGLYAYQVVGKAINSIFHANDYGIRTYLANQVISGCRITANTVGVDNIGSLRTPLFGCYLDNTTDTSGEVDLFLNDGADSVTLAGTDTDYGYSSSAGGDFNLTADATMRDVAITLPS